VSDAFLAFDLGAESGRAIVGHLRGGVLALDEIRRFPNGAIRQNGSLYWDVLRLWSEITESLQAASSVRLASVGVDGWGVDYELIGERGNLLENPYHYRDLRNEGMMDAVFERVSRERIYSVTGIQFLQINTLFQFYAACRLTPKVVDAAHALVTVPDLFNYWLGGRLCSEYTIATTTQFVDARTRTWARRLLDEIGLPTELLTEIVQPGTTIGALRKEIAAPLAGTPIVVPACHDTGSAVASVAAGGATAFLSSGTWSLLGTEIGAPVITAQARDLNFTNEGGAYGTIRFLKNVMGLWILESCRREWQAAGTVLAYDEMLRDVNEIDGLPAFIFPDDPRFLNPASMTTAIREQLKETGQTAIDDPLVIVKVVLDSLAFRYASVLQTTEELTGRKLRGVQVIGGGSRNRYLNQMTANASGLTVRAGLPEATVVGNVLVQAVSSGRFASLADARDYVNEHFDFEEFAAEASQALGDARHRYTDVESRFVE